MITQPSRDFSWAGFFDTRVCSSFAERLPLYMALHPQTTRSLDTRNAPFDTYPVIFPRFGNIFGGFSTPLHTTNSLFGLAKSLFRSIR